MSLTRPFLTALVLAGLALPALGQSPKTYLDGKRGEVTLPQGDLSFADRVISHSTGSGKIKETATNPQTALGAPNYSGKVTDSSFLSLGCGGDVVLQFVDNALVDLPGPDLYVFEVGPKVEGTFLSISQDGVEWRPVGEISGGRAEVDIGAAAREGESFRFVRLTDDNEDCGTNYAGADIDAVAAIGSAMRFVLDGEVLFDHDSAQLRPEARAALERLAVEIDAAGLKRFNVIGHTDSTGSAPYNLALSEARSLAVRDYLASLPKLSGRTINASGRGESEPVASNDTPEGRRDNRRVEIIGSDS